MAPPFRPVFALLCGIEMKYLAIVFLVMFATGCASLDVACRSAMDDGNWSLVKDTEDREKWLEASNSAERSRVYANYDSGIAAVCNSCGDDSARIKSITYLRGDDIVGITAITYGPY